MKKSSIFLMSLLSIAFVGCSDNYDPAVGPQSYLPESPINASDVSVTNTATTINIADYIDENEVETPIPMGTFLVKEGAMPANTIMKAEIEISQTEDFAKSAIVEANSLAETQEITIQPSDLEDAYFYGISKNPATTDLYIRTIMYTQTKGDAVARIGKPGETYYATSKITFTPLNRVSIAPAYYIIGGPNDWQASAINRSIKFDHSGEDVYVDPIFTVVFDAAASGDTWFAIGDDLACDAIANDNDWSQLYGIVGGESEAMSGQLDRRSNLGGDNSFCVKAGAKKIKVTIDMMEQTFTVKTLDFGEYFYQIGNDTGWQTSNALHGSPSTGKYQGYYLLDGEFKFKPNADNWDNDLEYVSGTTTSGTLTDAGGPNCPDPGAGFYQIDLDVAAMTYKVTEVETISIIGTVKGNWDTDVDMTYNKETGAWEVTEDLEAGEMKFRMNHDWSVSWGGNGSSKAYTDLTQNNGANLELAESGKYKVQLFIQYEGKNKVVLTKQ